MAHCKKLREEEAISFYIEVADFTKKQAAAAERKLMAANICSKYIRKGAPYYLPFEDSVVESIEQAFGAKLVATSIFAAAADASMALMRPQFAKFLASDLLHKELERRRQEKAQQCCGGPCVIA
jgi:hypothetical protein